MNIHSHELLKSFSMHKVNHPPIHASFHKPIMQMYRVAGCKSPRIPAPMVTMENTGFAKPNNHPPGFRSWFYQLYIINRKNEGQIDPTSLNPGDRVPVGQKQMICYCRAVVNIIIEVYSNQNVFTENTAPYNSNSFPG